MNQRQQTETEAPDSFIDTSIKLQRCQPADRGLERTKVALQDAVKGKRQRASRRRVPLPVSAHKGGHERGPVVDLQLHHVLQHVPQLRVGAGGGAA